MEFSHWLSLLSICLLGAMSPGPSLAVVLNAALRIDRGAGYRCATAHGVGVALYGLLTVTGLALLIARTPALYLAIQVLGAAYLLYLGIRALRSGGADVVPDQGMPGRQNAAMNGFMVAFLNPKLAIFMLALFSQFLTPGAGLREKAIMVATVGICDALWYSVVVTLVSHQAFLPRLQHNAKLIDRVFGAILIAVALTVVVRAVPVN